MFTFAIRFGEPLYISQVSRWIKNHAPKSLALALGVMLPKDLISEKLPQIS